MVGFVVLLCYVTHLVLVPPGFEEPILIPRKKKRERCSWRTHRIIGRKEGRRGNLGYHWHCNCTHTLGREHEKNIKGRKTELSQQSLLWGPQNVWLLFLRTGDWKRTECHQHWSRKRLNDMPHTETQIPVNRVYYTLLRQLSPSACFWARTN